MGKPTKQGPTERTGPVQMPVRPRRRCCRCGVLAPNAIVRRGWTTLRVGRERGHRLCNICKEQLGFGGGYHDWLADHADGWIATDVCQPPRRGAA